MCTPRGSNADDYCSNNDSTIGSKAAAAARVIEVGPPRGRTSSAKAATLGQQAQERGLGTLQVGPGAQGRPGKGNARPKGSGRLQATVAKAVAACRVVSDAQGGAAQESATLQSTLVLSDACNRTLPEQETG